MTHAIAASAEPIEVASNSADAVSGIDFSAIANDPETWIIVAFVTFFGLFAKFVLPMILKGLDKRSDTIRDQLEQASRLRTQAEELLATYQAERVKKEEEAEKIIADAKRDAQALRASAVDDLKLALERRSQQALDKITRAESEAIGFIRTQMIDVATQAVRDIVRTQLDGNAEDPAIARAISAIESKIH